MPGYCPDPLCNPLSDRGLSLLFFFIIDVFPDPDVWKKLRRLCEGASTDPWRSSDWSPLRFRFSRVGGGWNAASCGEKSKEVRLWNHVPVSLQVSPQSKEVVEIKKCDWCQAWEAPARLFRWRTGFKQPLESLRGLKSQDRSFGFPEEPRTTCYVITSALMGISRLMRCFFQ